MDSNVAMTIMGKFLSTSALNTTTLLTGLFNAVVYIHLPLMLERWWSMAQMDMTRNFMMYAVLEMRLDVTFSLHVVL